MNIDPAVSSDAKAMSDLIASAHRNAFEKVCMYIVESNKLLNGEECSVKVKGKLGGGLKI